MAVTRGRVVRGERAAGAKRLLEPGPGAEQRRRLSREEVEAHVSADRVVDIALTRAEAILAGARAEAERAAREAARAAAEGEQAKLAAAWLALRDADEKRAERDLDRAVALATVLAERLVGRAIELDPGVVAAIAREALAEARGARRVRIEANPADVDAVRSELSAFGPGWSPHAPTAAIEVTANDALARGSLTVHTELGTLDARLHPRLERLAAALRDALRSPE
jgi:flagellar biosynthesis/type III secretory pathway protein FliH